MIDFDSVQARSLLVKLYGDEPAVVEKQILRYRNLDEVFKKRFGETQVEFFSTPGRTEIGGNHTDHNAGRVLAAAIDLDSIAIVGKTNKDVVCVYSKGYSKPFIVDLADLNRQAAEIGTTTALIRGTAFRFRELGYKVGGFNACITSEVKVGSGLSSSASIEVLIGTILNSLFNLGSLPPEEIAKIGQWAENDYFGKPCGLMDQMTCAVGGMVTIDFRVSVEPQVKKVKFDFGTQSYRLVVVDTGGNHANLTSDYAAIPAEMKGVATFFEKTVCRELSFEELSGNIPKLRSKVGDRAILRALHFIGDNNRVVRQVTALEAGNFNRFLDLINESGDSSFMWLQNCFTTQNPSEQGVSLALALTKNYLNRIRTGACRVHGGGFAGTILVFLPEKNTAGYIAMIEKVFGKNSATVLTIRSLGSLCLNCLSL